MPAFQSFFMVFKASRSVFEITKIPESEEEMAWSIGVDMEITVVES